MYIILCFSRQLIEEERNTCKEHHNTVENGVKEQHQNLCVKSLFRIGIKVGGLNVMDN